MNKYIVLYHAPAAWREQMGDTTPEQMKASMDEWMVWAQKCGPALVDMGAPLGNGKRLDPASIADSDKGVVGFSIMEAESMDHVAEMLKGHPHFGYSDQCSIEVHEAHPIPGM